MNTKNEKIDERRKLVKELVELGLTINLISKNTRIPEATVSNDVSTFGGIRAFPDRPNKPNDIFIAVVKRYANLRYVKTGSIRKDGLSIGKKITRGSFEDKLIFILSRLLGIYETIHMMSGVLFSSKYLQYPKFPDQEHYNSTSYKDRNPYHIFIRAIIGDKQWNGHRFIVPREARMVVSFIFSKVVEGDLSIFEHSTLDNKSYAIELATEHIDKYRKNIASVWDEEIYLLIDKELDNLPQKEGEVIKMFFGKDCDSLTLEEIGVKFDLTRHRVRQIKEKAIRRLRSFVRNNPSFRNLLPKPPEVKE